MSATSCALALASLLALTGCSGTLASKHVRSAALIAEIEVTAERADAAELRATFATEEAAGRRAVHLRGGDALHVTMAGRVRSVRGGRHGRYRVALPLGEGALEVALTRARDASTLHSRGTLGPPFTLASLASTEHSRARSTLTLTWSPRDEWAHVDVTLTGPCIAPTERSLGLDPGTLVLTAGELSAAPGQEAARCPVEVTVRRTRLGDLDPALDQGGGFRLQQVRTIRFVSAP